MTQKIDGEHQIQPGTIPGGGSGHTIQDEGTPLTARTNLNFVGGGVNATDDVGNDRTDVTIPDMAAQIVAATQEDNLQGADVFGYHQASSGLLRKTPWSNIFGIILDFVGTFFAGITHAHTGSDDTYKLLQANTHETPDTDSGPTSLHHTIGTGANQAAGGNHTHTFASLTSPPSGTYSPTLFLTTNVASATIDGPFTYMRIGNIVSVAGSIQIDPTAAANTVLGISLPIASDFTTAIDGTGNGTSQLINCAGNLAADTTNNRMTLTFQSPVTTNAAWRVVFMYEIK